MCAVLLAPLYVTMTIVYQLAASYLQRVNDSWHAGGAWAGLPCLVPTARCSLAPLPPSAARCSLPPPPTPTTTTHTPTRMLCDAGLLLDPAPPVRDVCTLVCPAEFLYSHLNFKNSLNLPAAVTGGGRSRPLAYSMAVAYNFDNSKVKGSVGALGGVGA